MVACHWSQSFISRLHVGSFIHCKLVWRHRLPCPFWWHMPLPSHPTIGRGFDSTAQGSLQGEIPDGLVFLPYVYSYTPIWGFQATIKTYSWLKAWTACALSAGVCVHISTPLNMAAFRNWTISCKKNPYWEIWRMVVQKRVRGDYSNTSFDTHSESSGQRTHSVPW